MLIYRNAYAVEFVLRDRQERLGALAGWKSLLKQTLWPLADSWPWVRFVRAFFGGGATQHGRQATMAPGEAYWDTKEPLIENTNGVPFGW